MRRKPRKAARNEDPKAAAMKIEWLQHSLDEALKASFPASDPPALIAPHSSDK